MIKSVFSRMSSSSFLDQSIVFLNKLVRALCDENFWISVALGLAMLVISWQVALVFIILDILL